ncbi:MAG: bifunctional pyr operon transcriptional regulator/uracil phosphoribosyltransferase PyrR [Candidatus Sumerlaeia bacterium]|nr:bifunctional pyr operon transcriptional regulator/uracil phosphoribosyltransferase PyrR [Candidatus Sumerlaeia bacterium]
MSPAAGKKAARKKATDSTPRPRKTPKVEVFLDASEIARALDRIKTAIRREFPDPSRLVLLGVRTRGVPLADRLGEALGRLYGCEIPRGMLDITLYRDDLSTLDYQPMVRDSEIPFDITGAHIVLVDDVLFTGRTVRAALDEIIDFGRPSLVRLAVLVDRGGREYPIQADYVGKAIELSESQFVRVQLAEVDGKDEVLLLDRK